MLTYWKTLLWAIIILVLSGLSGDTVGGIKFLNIPHIDKLFHAGMYFILAFLWLFEHQKNSLSERTKPLVMVYILVICIFYGVLMEFFQDVLFNKRSAEIYDVFANSVGAILAVPAILFLKSFFSKKTD